MNKENLIIENVICEQMPGPINGLGEFIHHDNAYSRIQAYLKSMKPISDDPNFVYGNIFGLDFFKNLINTIDKYNLDNPSSKKIVGIRVYNALTARPYLPNPKQELADVVIVPVLEDGSDISHVCEPHEPIQPGIEIAAIPLNVRLSGGMPCPNQCR